MVGLKTKRLQHEVVGPYVRRKSGDAKPVSRTFCAQLQATAERLAATEIAFIDHPHYRKRNGAALIEALRPDTSVITPRARSAAAGIAFMPEIVSAPLLVPAQEQYLFLKMNFLRFRAEQLRRKLRPQQPDAAHIAEIERLLAEAQSIRNQIAEANVRLLVAAAKKLSHSLDHLSDLIGEGLIPLLRAIDLFDVGRGHRFSTYATWAVRNQMIRLLRKQRTLPELALTDEQAGWQHIPDERPALITDDAAPQKRQQLVVRLLSSLSDREQQIVRARYGLDGEPAGQSLADISARMGLSKERIRQVALSALEKLRQRAEDEGCDPDDEVLSGP